MIDATRLRGVVDERAARPTELIIEADAGGKGEQSDGDAGVEVAGGAGAVPFGPSARWRCRSCRRR